MTVSNATKLKAQDENRLKKLLAESMLDVAAVTGAVGLS